ncbi:hypothetical protein HDU83_004133 [Entophlyctis luteolus]|nr:hypothetical protein HDU83_004133 [Entophlyctis luteolus]
MMYPRKCHYGVHLLIIQTVIRVAVEAEITERRSQAGTPQDYFRRDSKATDGNWDNVAVDSEVNKKSPWSKANDSWGGFADDEDHARREEKRGLLANGRE